MASDRLPTTRLRRARGSLAAAALSEESVLRMALDYLDLQYAELLAQEPLVRSGIPEAVHEMRSATRRLRSALDIYGCLFGAGPRQELGHELKWLARVLGRERDAEVMRERLQARLGELPEKWRTAAACEPIEHAIGAACDAGRTQVLQALVSARYRRLLDDLARFRGHPPATGRAFRPASTDAAGIVNNQGRIVDRAHRAMLRTRPGHARDLSLHRLRKDTKQLLHAAESVAGIHPKHAPALARTAHRLQRILGNHHDSVMTREFLDSLTADPALPEEVRYACERIRELEEELADSAARQYSRARRKSQALRLRR
ncbi:hypothetical protein GCM10009715_33580 [Paeniglutamicibacter psychrophenolicus]|uniref:CHAD domain-containing protein n=1 Tax=Paeniglutamicibacter psychrophenolicus TaxID=257454 RepID=A0ABS4W9R7_9MICC|nr:CHAD domain-containing protein [Paeniglutamicibacter psychrophenolicus]MBP2372945.1 CHAD domain-containing protein [Paeniglutamicibacter psychrophenolicus]